MAGRHAGEGGKLSLVLDPAAGTAFLGVESSLCGWRWVGPPPAEDRLALAIAQRAGLPDLVARLLARRGVAPDQASAYLEPRLRDLMSDPSDLVDMDRAAARLVAAAIRGERVAIFADYDVDGGVSAALLIRWLRALGQAATLYVPDRIDEGYGPNEAAMRRLGAAHDLVICVDCGTLSHGPIAAAGVDVLVIDHHQTGETLPPAHAVVNPKRPDESGALAHLCAAGVVFLLLVAAGRCLRAEGREPPDLIGLLDLVALATIADVVPLVGLNRAFVRQGLRVMRQGGRAGLVALAAEAGLAGPPTVHTLGYVFGPRVNAGGRVGAADLGARLLATDDPEEAAALALRLERLNAERRQIEAAVRAAAEAEIEARIAAEGGPGPLVWAAGEGWHPGVVGIVAARLKERFRRPAVVIGLDGEEGKGSGRSVQGIDLGAAIATLAREGLIPKGGGHAMAAGLSVTRAGLPSAMARLSALLDRQGAGEAAPGRLRIDGLLAPQAATADLCEAVEAVGPFGAGSPSPVVAVPRARILHARPIGQNHLALDIAGEDGGRLAGIAFGCAGTALGAALAAGGPGRLHLVGRLELDLWNGRRRAKLCVEDAAPAAEFPA
jgi:single-stranded-DNA-specific exonuclease